MNADVIAAVFAFQEASRLEALADAAIDKARAVLRAAEKDADQRYQDRRSAEKRLLDVIRVGGAA
jgi:hypothetical protein